MSRNSRKSAKLRRDKEKQARRSANQASYASMRDSGNNSKRKRSSSNSIPLSNTTSREAKRLKVGEIGALLKAGPNRFKSVKILKINQDGYQIRLVLSSAPNFKMPAFNVGFKNVRPIRKAN